MTDIQIDSGTRTEVTDGPTHLAQADKVIYTSEAEKLLAPNHIDLPDPLNNPETLHVLIQDVLR